MRKLIYLTTIFVSTFLLFALFRSPEGVYATTGATKGNVYMRHPGTGALINLPGVVIYREGNLSSQWDETVGVWLPTVED